MGLLNDNIRKARSATNKTLEEVAAKVGVSRQTIQKYESGVISNIPSDKIEKLASALNVTPAYLMGWESEEKLKAALKDNSARLAMQPAHDFLEEIGCKLSYSVNKKQDGSQTISDIKIIDETGSHCVTYEGLEQFVANVKLFIKFNYLELINQNCPKDYKYLFKKADIEPEIRVLAAHNDNHGEEQQELMAKDIERIRKMKKQK